MTYTPTDTDNDGVVDVPVDNESVDTDNLWVNPTTGEVTTVGNPVSAIIADRQRAIQLQNTDDTVSSQNGGRANIDWVSAGTQYEKSRIAAITAPPKEERLSFYAKTDPLSAGDTGLSKMMELGGGGGDANGKRYVDLHNLDYLSLAGTSQLNIGDEAGTLFKVDDSLTVVGRGGNGELTARRTDDTGAARLGLENSAGDQIFRIQHDPNASGNIRFYKRHSGTLTERFQINDNGTFTFKDGSGNRTAVLYSNGDLEIAGSLSEGVSL